jgi:preprotein translocase subunit SecA
LAGAPIQSGSDGEFEPEAEGGVITASAAPAAKPEATIADLTRNIQKKKEKELDALQLIGSASGPSTQQNPVVRSGKKVGRNELCPCGSGKKYKRCCGA